MELEHGWEIRAIAFVCNTRRYGLCWRFQNQNWDYPNLGTVRWADGSTLNDSISSITVVQERGGQDPNFAGKNNIHVHDSYPSSDMTWAASVVNDNDFEQRFVWYAVCATTG